MLLIKFNLKMRCKQSEQNVVLKGYVSGGVTKPEKTTEKI